MLEISVSKNRNSCFIGREVIVGRVAAHFCLTLIVKELEISVGKVGW
jgi:hypothetical protein